MCFGDHDLVGVIEMPDNVSAAAFAMAILKGGACGCDATPREQLRTKVYRTTSI